MMVKRYMEVSKVFLYTLFPRLPYLINLITIHAVTQAKNLRVILDSFLFLIPQIWTCQLYPVNEPQFQPHLSLSTCTTPTLTKPYSLLPGPLRQSPDQSLCPLLPPQSIFHKPSEMTFKTCNLVNVTPLFQQLQWFFSSHLGENSDFLTWAPGSCAIGPLTNSLNCFPTSYPPAQHHSLVTLAFFLKHAEFIPISEPLDFFSLPRLFFSDLPEAVSCISSGSQGERTSLPSFSFTFASQSQSSLQIILLNYSQLTTF